MYTHTYIYLYIACSERVSNFAEDSGESETRGRAHATGTKLVIQGIPKIMLEGTVYTSLASKNR